MEENKIDITKFFDMFYKNILRNKKIIAFILIVCTLVSVGKTFISFDTLYSSKAVFIASNSDKGNIYSAGDDTEELLETFSTVLRSEMMNKVIMQSMDLNYVPGSVSINRIPETNLMELVVTSKEPKLAYDMIYCILNNYNQVTDIVMSDINITLFDTPKFAEKPNAVPDYLNSTIKGFTLGLGISFVYILVLSFIRKTINTNDDVKNILNLTNLSTIPMISNSTHSSLLVSNPGIQYQIKHAFQELRLHVEQEKKKANSKVFMITSTMPNEGKSTVSSNLAISLAQKGNRVVLVDTDLRNPSVMRIIKCETHDGSVTDYLNGICSLHQVLNPYLDLPLDVIYGNEFSTEATEHLSKDKFEEFVHELRSKYDYVILDVPPLFMMEDALLVAKHSDSAIVVIKQDFVNSYDILDSMEELQGYTQIIGTVINQAIPSIFTPEQSSYGYGYGYGRK